MAVVEFERQGFENWLQSVRDYLLSDKSEKSKKELLDGFHKTAITLISSLPGKTVEGGSDELLRTVFDVRNVPKVDYNDFEQYVKNFVTCLETVCDMICSVNPAMVSVLCSNGVFEEAMGNEIPYLEVYYDSFSGLYKYCTSISTSYFN